MYQHKCDKIKCGNCKVYVDLEHKCHMLKNYITSHSERYVFFDFESKLYPTTNKHIVTYCVAHYFAGVERKFTNVNGFCTWAFDRKHKNYTFIAHYGKGYDFQFVAKWLASHGVKPNIIHNGQKHYTIRG